MKMALIMKLGKKEKLKTKFKILNENQKKFLGL